MWLQVPGLFTRIMEATVKPLKKSSDNNRGGEVCKIAGLAIRFAFLNIKSALFLENNQVVG